MLEKKFLAPAKSLQSLLVATVLASATPVPAQAKDKTLPINPYILNLGNNADYPTNFPNLESIFDSYQQNSVSDDDCPPYICNGKDNQDQEEGHKDTSSQQTNDQSKDGLSPGQIFGIVSLGLGGLSFVASAYSFSKPGTMCTDGNCVEFYGPFAYGCLLSGLGFTATGVYMILRDW